jgi:hypothetical protein
MLDWEATVSLNLNNICLDGIRAVIGMDDLHSSLDLAGITDGDGFEGKNSFSCIDSLGQVFSNLFGTRACQGIMQRSGAATFKYFLHEFREALGFDALDYRLQSCQKRLQAGLEKLAQIISRDPFVRVQIVQEGNCWNWQISDSRMAGGKEGRQNLNRFSIGFLQTFLTWCGIGKSYRVSEGTD